MDLLSLTSSQAAATARSNLTKAGAAVSLSVARLSSGERLVRAADDVAAMSISEKLAGRVITLRQALNNTLQGQSYLGVADGALNQINDMLQRMNALAVQSGSGSLSATERGFLNQEFRALFDEIDRIAANTNFNGVKVLQQDHGDLYIGQTDIKTPATRAYGHLVFTANPAVGQTIVLNKVPLTVGTDFQLGAGTLQTVQNLADALNNHSNPLLQEATYEAVQGTLIIRHKALGAMGNIYAIDELSSTANASFFTLGQNVDVGLNRFTLMGGADGRVNVGSVRVSGNVNSTLITQQNQRQSEARYYFWNPLNVVDGNLFRLDNGVAASVNFIFRNNPLTPYEVRVGSDQEESFRNMMSVVNNFLAVSPTVDDINGIRQLEFRRDLNNIYATSRLPGIPYDFTGATLADALSIGETGPGTTIEINTHPAPPFSLDNGSDVGGVNTNGIVNTDFIGKISGFTASYLGANQVRLSLTVGEHTYHSTVANTAPLANTSQFFSSETGGYFSMELAANEGMKVSTQEEAHRYASALDAALSKMNFVQKRPITMTHDPALMGVSFSATMDDFRNIAVEDVQVISAQGRPTAEIIFTINGERYEGEYRIGRAIGTHETFTFASTTNPDKKLDFTTNGLGFDLSTDAAAAHLEAALKRGIGATAIDIDDAVITREFQVGFSSEETIGIRLNYISTDTLFSDTSVNITTQADAEAAAGMVGAAIDRITQTRAQAGAQQRRFEVASAEIQVAITNQDAARGVLADTDIAAESTALATQTVLQQAGISMLAQANLLREDLITSLFEQYGA